MGAEIRECRKKYWRFGVYDFVAGAGHSQHAISTLMIDVTRELSQRFKNMALVCAFIVVMIHCVSGFNVFGPLVFYVMDDSCFRIAVPFFFFASGFSCTDTLTKIIGGAGRF